MDRMEQEIGDAAGKIWDALRENGPMTKSRIAQQTGLKAQLVDQGIGWLARENKLTWEEHRKTKKIDLRA